MTECPTCDQRFPWHWAGVLLGLAFLVFGAVGAFLSFDRQALAYQELKATRAACMAGNERACRVYQIEWGK